MSTLLVSVTWLQPLARGDLHLQIARTGSASQGRVRARFVLCLLSLPDHPQLVTAGGRILVKPDLHSEQFRLSCVLLRDV